MIHDQVGRCSTCNMCFINSIVYVLIFLVSLQNDDYYYNHVYSRVVPEAKGEQIELIF
jgi:hypothetical protein